MDIGSLIPIGGGIVSGIMSGLSNSASAKNAEYLQQMNIAWQREQHQNRHQWETADLRKAGLNPILSANSGGAIASAPQGAAPREPVSGVGVSTAQGIASARQLSLNERAIASQEQLNASTASKQDAEARDLEDKHRSDFWSALSGLHGSSAAQKEAAIPLIKAQVDTEVQRAVQLQTQVRELEEQIKLVRERIRTEKSVQSREYSTASLNGLTGKLRTAETNLTDILTGLRATEEVVQREGMFGRIFGAGGLSLLRDSWHGPGRDSPSTGSGVVQHLKTDVASWREGIGSAWNSFKGR